MSDEPCACRCEDQVFGDCGQPGGTFIDHTGAYLLEATGAMACIGERLCPPAPQQRTTTAAIDTSQEGSTT